MKNQSCTAMPEPAPPAACATCGEPGIVPDAELWAKTWLKLGVALVFAGQGMVLGLGLNTADPPLEPDTPVYWVLHGGLLFSALVVMALLGGPLARATLASLRLRRIAVEALFSLSILGAMAGSLVCTFTGEGAVYYEVVAIVLVVYTLGKTLGLRTKARVVGQVREIRQSFDYAWWVPPEGGERVRKAVRELKPGDEVWVPPGDPVTVDGVVAEGEGFVRETALTGEITPAHCQAGSRVLAGSYALDGHFRIRVEHAGGARGLDGVLETVEHATLAPSALQEQADRLVRWFVPLVAAISLATFAAWMVAGPWSRAVFNSMAVLLVACPCALGLATPIAVWSGLWRLSRMGLVARSGTLLDSLARVRCLIFDKTGTLSEDRLQVAEFIPAAAANFPVDVLFSAIRTAETGFSHPVARTLAEYAAARSQTPVELLDVQVVSGRGIRSRVRAPGLGTFELAVGTPALFQDLPANSFPEVSTGAYKTLIQVAVDSRPMAVFVLREQLRGGLVDTFARLAGQGLRVVILSGDPQPAWQSIEGVAVESGLDPNAKARRTRQLRDACGVTVFVGDGVNDTAAMAVSDASIAIGEGADLARATSSAVLFGHNLGQLPDAIALCRKTRAAIRGNLLFAATYNFFGMALAAAGMLHPVVAALLMMGSSFFVSMRAIRSTAG